MHSPKKSLLQNGGGLSKIISTISINRNGVKNMQHYKKQKTQQIETAGIWLANFILLAAFVAGEIIK